MKDVKLMWKKPCNVSNIQTCNISYVNAYPSRIAAGTSTKPCRARSPNHWHASCLVPHSFIRDVIGRTRDCCYLCS